MISTALHGRLMQWGSKFEVLQHQLQLFPDCLNFPLTIEVVAGDTPVVEGLEIWVAVVVRDTAGNAQKLTSDCFEQIDRQ